MEKIMGQLTDQQEQQFSEYYDQYYSDAVHYANRKIGSLHDAEDIVEESFIYCYKHFNDYDPEKSAFRTWLYLVVNSRVKNYYRDRKEEVSIVDLEPVLSEEEPNMEQSVYLEQVRKCISTALQELPELQRRIVIMKYFMNKTSNEIAAELGLNAGNVRVLLSRTLPKMQKYCEQLMEGLD